MDRLVAGNDLTTPSSHTPASASARSLSACRVTERVKLKKMRPPNFAWPRAIVFARESSEEH